MSIDSLILDTLSLPQTSLLKLQDTDRIRLARQAKVKAARLRISQRSVLIVNGAHVSVDSLVLDGALVVDAVPEAHVRIDGLSVENKGWRWMALKPDKPMKEEWAIRCDTSDLLKSHQHS